MAAEVMEGAQKWIYLNWISILILTGLFSWKHTEVLLHLGPHATTSALSTSFTVTTAYIDWYIEQLHNGKAFWFPDLFLVYFLIPTFVGLQIYMCKMEDNSKLISFWFVLPNLIMSAQMLVNLNIDTLLYLNVRPKGPLCGCLNSTFASPALYDCQCYIPFHEGTARLLTADPTNVTERDYLEAGVAQNQIPTRNLSIQYVAATHELDSLNTWDVEALTWEFALLQCSIFVVLTRLKPFLHYQQDVLEDGDNSLFSGVLSHFYYLLAECADALSLFDEFVEHGDYFVNRVDLVWGLFLPSTVAITQLMQCSSPPRVRKDSRMKLVLQGQRLFTKAITLIFVNTPLLVIRCYLVSLYGDEVKISIIFALLIVREAGMVFMGTLELIYEIKVYRNERQSQARVYAS